MSAKGSRSLDRIFRTLSGLMRSRNLPRPDRLVISTRSRSAHAEFTTGTPPDLLAAVLRWAPVLDGVELAVTHRPTGLLTLAATGATGTGVALGLVCTVPASAVGIRVLDLDGERLTFLRAGHRVLLLDDHVAEQVDCFEAARLVATARRLGAVSGVAA